MSGILHNLCAWQKSDIAIGDGALYALIGFVFVFLGITLLICIFWVFGKVMARVNSRSKTTVNKRQKQTVEAPKSVVETNDDGVSEELVAVISAAIAAYYEGENVPCDFVVRRIKKL